MTLVHWIEWSWLAHLAVGVIASLHAIRIKREASSALLWLFIIWSFPFLGAAIYAAYGVDRISAKAALRETAASAFRTHRAAHGPAPAASRNLLTDPWAQSLERALNTVLPDLPSVEGNRIQVFVTGDEAYPPMRAAMAAAQHHIHLQTFILANDSIGRDWMDLLVQKAHEGVQVRVLYDRFGSTPAVLTGFIHRYRRAAPRLRIAGWSLANPWRRQVQVNLRNHRKILVVDGRVAFTGGMNVTEINVTRPGRPADRDFHFEVHGPIVRELQFSFLDDWHFMTGEPAESLLAPEYFPELPPCGSARVRLVPGAPTGDGETLPDILFTLLTMARRQILLVSPYFVPTLDILRALRSAALRGLDVRLLVPKENNHVYAGWAGRAYYGTLLQAGARIVERHPPFLHAKALIIDDTVALVGTANVDSRSLRLNYETNLLVMDRDFLGQLKEAVLAEFQCGDELNWGAWVRRPHWHMWLERTAALLSPTL